MPWHLKYSFSFNQGSYSNWNWCRCASLTITYSTIGKRPYCSCSLSNQRLGIGNIPFRLIQEIIQIGKDPAVLVWKLLSVVSPTIGKYPYCSRPLSNQRLCILTTLFRLSHVTFEIGIDVTLLVWRLMYYVISFLYTTFSTYVLALFQFSVLATKLFLFVLSYNYPNWNWGHCASMTILYIAC